MGSVQRLFRQSFPELALPLSSGTRKEVPLDRVRRALRARLLARKIQVFILCIRDTYVKT